MKENIEELKRLLYEDELTPYGGRKLTNYYEKQIEKLQKENEDWQKAYQEEKDKKFELIRENQKLKDKYAVFVKMSSEVIANSIPVQKVKDKIEELSRKEKIELKGVKGPDRYYIKQQYMYQATILQELLERKEK